MWVSVITSFEGTVVTIRTTTIYITRSCILSTERVHGFHVSLRTNSSYFANAVTRFLSGIEYHVVLTHASCKKCMWTPTTKLMDL